MPVRHDIEMMSPTSVRKITPENVSHDITAQPRNTRLVCGRDASV